MGAEVTGVCSARNADLVRSLGAAHVIDYAAHDFTDGAVRHDMILDNVGNHPLSRLRRALTPAGILVVNAGGSPGHLIGAVGSFVQATLVNGFVRQGIRPLIPALKRDELTAVTEMIDAGKLSPVLDRAYRWPTQPRACAMSNRGTRAARSSSRPHEPTARWRGRQLLRSTANGDRAAGHTRCWPLIMRLCRNGTRQRTGSPPPCWRSPRAMRSACRGRAARRGTFQQNGSGAPAPDRGWPRGATSDDTAQMLLVSQLLADSDGLPMAEQFMARLAAVIDEIRGIGPSTSQSIEHYRRTGTLPDAGSSQRPTNGAAMRMPPVGWMSPAGDDEFRRELTRVLAIGTHQAPAAIGAACVVTAMTRGPWKASRWTPSRRPRRPSWAGQPPATQTCPPRVRRWQAPGVRRPTG